MVNRFPIRFSLIVLITTIIVLAGGGLRSFFMYEAIVHKDETVDLIEHLRSDVIYLDEVLTMSASMAAKTGNQQWVDRYRHHEPLLEQTINQAIEKFEGQRNKNSATVIQDANNALVILEHEALEHVARGDLDAAWQILISNEYNHNKKFYAAGIKKVVADLELAHAGLRASTRNQLTTNIISTAIAIPLLILCWLVMGRKITAWREEIQTKTDQNIQVISDLRASKTLLKESEGRYALALERSNEELQQFTFAASHDLQEPVRKILAFGSRLEKNCAGVIDEKGVDYLNRITISASRLQILMDDLLTYSRVATKARPFTDINLSTLVTDVFSDLETNMDEAGAKGIVGAMPTIQGDKGQISLLITNLISNSVKFKKSDTPLVIEVNAMRTSDNTSITINDTGIGFDPKFTDRIFKMFERLHGRGEYSGTGIGLAVCKKIAERHGGTLTAEGRPGDGATFTLTLPTNQVGSA